MTEERPTGWTKDALRRMRANSCYEVSALVRDIPGRPDYRIRFVVAAASDDEALEKASELVGQLWPGRPSQVEVQLQHPCWSHVGAD